MIQKLTINPAKLLRLEKGTLSLGADADITLIDPDLEWIVDVDRFASKSRNSPYNGRKIRGRATHTIVGGRVVWSLASTEAPGGA